MVINTRYKFIFVHVPKAAGTSVTRILEQAKGNNKRWLAKTKHETLSGLQSEIGNRVTIRDRILKRSPIDYFTFGFVRNPWDRMSSFYRYLVEKRPKKEIDTVSSFKDFLIQSSEGVPWIQELYSMKPQLDYFTLPNNRMEIGFLGHFEHLSEDINSVSRRIGLPMPIGHDNRSSNTGSDYREYYDTDMVEIVASKFSEEIDLFGYAFDERYPKRRCSEGLNRRR